MVSVKKSDGHGSMPGYSAGTTKQCLRQLATKVMFYSERTLIGCSRTRDPEDSALERGMNDPFYFCIYDDT